MESTPLLINSLREGLANNHGCLSKQKARIFPHSLGYFWKRIKRVLALNSRLNTTQ